MAAVPGAVDLEAVVGALDLPAALSVKARPDLRAYGRASRATVVRLALARGLDVLAAECAAKR